MKEIPHPELLANKLMYGRVGVRKKPCICTFPDGTERTFADIQSAHAVTVISTVLQDVSGDMQ